MDDDRPCYLKLLMVTIYGITSKCGGGGVKALADTSVKKVFYMPPKILIMLGYSNFFKFSIYIQENTYPIWKIFLMF